MNQAATKKQNRILLVVLVGVLAAVVSLIALTGNANRKAAPEKKQEPQIAEGPHEPAKKTEEIRGTVTEDGKKPVNEEKKKTEPAAPEEPEKLADKPTVSEEAEEAIEVSVPVTPPEDMLPSFCLPVEAGVVLKECRLLTPVFSVTMNDYRTHTGVDFAASPGSPVFAAAAGEVAEVYNDPMMGTTITLKHNGKALTRYQGLAEESANLVSVGEKVAAGQLIGSAGETALIESAEDPHVHFEMMIGGVRVDPAEYLPVMLLSEIPED